MSQLLRGCNFCCFTIQIQNNQKKSSCEEKRFKYGFDWVVWRRVLLEALNCLAGWRPPLEINLWSLVVVASTAGLKV